jgi:hypothetical protein
MVRLSAIWDEKEEDIWVFDSEEGKNELVIKLDSFDFKKDQNLKLCIEFIIHYIPKKSA